MSLQKYRQKRNFTKTPEPAGKKKPATKHKSLLYIIQKHAASHLHYDFRLELNGVLLSWAVPKGPSLDPNVKRLAMHVEDHPVEYGNFEGIIPKGQYGGGTVMLWDKGEWIPEEENPTESYHKGKLSFTLKGKKLKGRWKLFRINNDDKTWLLVKADDKYAKSAKDYDITVKKPRSVLTGQSMEKITENYTNVWDSKSGKHEHKNSLTQLTEKLKADKYPHQVHPQLATLVDKPPVGEKWLHEIKLDGYRIVAFKKDNKTKLITRNSNDWTSKFQSVAKEINKAIKIKNAIFDGEIVMLDSEQRSDFQLLQNSLKTPTGKPFIYYIFDLLYYDKYNLMHLPLLERKNILAAILPKNNHILRYSDHIVGSGKEILAKACKLGLEGIVSKNAELPYIQKRSHDWLKSKCTLRQEFVIAGYTQPHGGRKYFGSLLLGVYNKKKELIYAGNVGTGFTEVSLKQIFSKLSKNKTATMPFRVKPAGSKNVIWLKPKLMAEVEFTEWTEDGSLRHPSFKGLRSDKNSREVIKEKPKSIKKIAGRKGKRI